VVNLIEIESLSCVLFDIESIILLEFGNCSPCFPGCIPPLQNWEICLFHLRLIEAHHVDRNGYAGILLSLFLFWIDCPGIIRVNQTLKGTWFNMEMNYDEGVSFPVNAIASLGIVADSVLLSRLFVSTSHLIPLMVISANSIQDRAGARNSNLPRHRDHGRCRLPPFREIILQIRSSLGSSAIARPAWSFGMNFPDP